MNRPEGAAKEVGMADLSPLLEEVLRSGGTVELTVTGNSMWPMLHHKVSRVRLAPVGQLKKGDLPLYRRRNGAFVLHRIAEASADGSYTCCGDNQWHLEHGLQRDQMVAVATHFCRKGNSWVSTQNPAYRLYARFWLAVRPLRRIVFGGWRRLKKALSV